MALYLPWRVVEVVHELVSFQSGATATGFLHRDCDPRTMSCLPRSPTLISLYSPQYLRSYRAQGPPCVSGVLLIWLSPSGCYGWLRRFLWMVPGFSLFLWPPSAFHLRGTGHAQPSGFTMDGASVSLSPGGFFFFRCSGCVSLSRPR